MNNTLNNLNTLCSKEDLSAVYVKHVNVWVMTAFLVALMAAAADTNIVLHLF